jgi:hypothetical protein
MSKTLSPTPQGRPLCSVCRARYRAVAYTKKNGTRQYRSACEHCRKRRRSGELSTAKTIYERAGYKKKATCDLCGYRSTYSTQILVYHVDGNTQNCTLSNLRSVCLCCAEVVQRKNTVWARGSGLSIDN